MYTPGTAANESGDPCLQPGRTLPLGYGSGEIPRITLPIPEGREQDFGVFRFVFTARSVDLSNVVRMDTLQAVASRGPQTMFIPDIEVDDSPQLWGVVDVPLVLARVPNQT